MLIDRQFKPKGVGEGDNLKKEIEDRRTRIKAKEWETRTMEKRIKGLYRSKQK